MYGVDCNIREGGEVGFFVFESEVTSLFAHAVKIARLKTHSHYRSNMAGSRFPFLVVDLVTIFSRR
jgi:hypothetical protein